MPGRPSDAALDLAMRMDAADALWLLGVCQQPGMTMLAGAPRLDALVEAAHIVCEWVDTYGPCPTHH